MVWRGYGILCIHFYFILLYFILFIYLFFCLEETLGKDTYMRATSATDLVILSTVPFRKFPNHNYVKVSSQQLRHALPTAF